MALILYIFVCMFIGLLAGTVAAQSQSKYALSLALIGAAVTILWINATVMAPYFG